MRPGREPVRLTHLLLVKRLEASYGERRSADSPDVVAGLAPSSVSARRSHFDSVIGWTRTSAAICSSVTKVRNRVEVLGYGLPTALFLPGAAYLTSSCTVSGEMSGI